MNKKDFLHILKQSLDGEVSSAIIEQNIKYYDQYINGRNEEEEQKILDSLGDPRLIAKTIIESEKIAKSKNKYSEASYGYQNNSYIPREENQKERRNHNNRSQSSRRNFSFFPKFRWYHKLSLVIFLLLIFFILFIIGKILVVFGLPIILILLLYSMFRRK